MKTFQVAAFGATLLLASTASAQGLVGLGDKTDGDLVASTAKDAPKEAVQLAAGAALGIVGGDVKEVQTLASEGVNAVHVAGSLVPDKSAGQILQRREGEGDDLNLEDALAPLTAITDKFTGSAIKTRDGDLGSNVVTDTIDEVTGLLGLDGLASEVHKRADTGADELTGVLSTVEGLLGVNADSRKRADTGADALTGALDTVEGLLGVNSKGRKRADPGADELTGVLNTVEGLFGVNADSRKRADAGADALTGALDTVEGLLGINADSKKRADAGADELTDALKTIEGLLTTNVGQSKRADAGADELTGALKTIESLLSANTDQVKRADAGADELTGALKTVQGLLGINTARRSADAGSDELTGAVSTITKLVGLNLGERKKRDKVEGYHNNSPLFFASVSDAAGKLVKMVGQGLPNDVPTTSKRVVDELETAFVKRATHTESSPLTDYEKKLSAAFGKYTAAVKDLLPALPETPAAKRDAGVDDNALTDLAKAFLDELHARDLVLPPLEILPGSGPKANAFAQEAKEGLTKAWESLHIAKRHQKMSKQRRH
ncbi:hypothetical protein FA10DRAFT_266435 [Acaromyces ingoldii]|uniref:Uncharacterized protein n=1 Tax=Acaromyces ingoldii TaxID=215250 RepID=A0A316YM63_9BASI|nr:hypothetical protein FA10DRAFT_266435 [Acaromyces ingoldii]PWN89894.1 hypothetical protein FA10DRAFT_266435 [Acaromyces ingoldii]